MASHEAPQCARILWHSKIFWLLATGGAMKSLKVLMYTLFYKLGRITNQSSFSISGTGPVKRSNNRSESLEKRWRLAIRISARTLLQRPAMLLVQSAIRSLAPAANPLDGIVMGQGLVAGYHGCVHQCGDTVKGVTAAIDSQCDRLQSSANLSSVSRVPMSA